MRTTEEVEKAQERDAARVCVFAVREFAVAGAGLADVRRGRPA